MSPSDPDYRNPEKRQHFVYRAYDKNGFLLYVGCSLNPEQRWKDHKANRSWAHLAVSFRLAGPYNYDTARRLEKEALAAGQPLYAYTPLKWAARGKANAASRRAMQEAAKQGLCQHEVIEAGIRASQAEWDRVLNGAPDA